MLCMLQTLQDRLASLESGVCSLRSETTFLGHAVTSQGNDLRFLKSEILERLGWVGDSCGRIEKQLDTLMQNRGITVQTNVKQSLMSCRKGCTVETPLEGSSHSKDNKRKSLEQGLTSREASTKSKVWRPLFPHNCGCALMHKTSLLCAYWVFLLCRALTSFSLALLLQSAGRLKGTN